jgi:hypothetical protein
MTVAAGDCPNCGKPVQWAETENGTRLTLELRPSRRGTIAIIDGVAVIMTANRARRADVVVYPHHHSVCKTYCR